MSRLAPGTVLAAFSAAAASVILLAVVFHALGLASAYRSHGYPFSQYLSSCLTPAFEVAWLALALILGLVSRTAWSVAAGMVSVLPAATILELIADPTSHNLLGLEIVLLWLPALLVTFGFAVAGRRMGLRLQSRGAK